MTDQSDSRNAILTAITVLGVAALFIYGYGIAALGAKFAIPVAFFAIGGGGLLLLGPVGRALARRLDRQLPDAANAELLQELSLLRERLAEVEGRLDFTERVLSRLERPDGLPERVER